mgnify:CR=1 FL=1
MYKIVTSFLFVVLCVGAFAQPRGSYLDNSIFTKHQAQIEKYLFSPKSMSYFLVARRSSDKYECKTFFYDDIGRAIAVKDSLGSDVLVIDSIVYDGSNNVIQINGYQYLDDQWKHVYIVNYAYDDNGNRVQRTNFNSAGTETFTQGGVYDYTYVQGKLVYYEAYFGNYQHLFETCDLTYDDQGRLEEELFKQGYDVVENSVKQSYTYDERGLLSMIVTYNYDYDWFEESSDVFLYDNAGNCVDHSKYDDYGNIVDQREYEYDLEIPSSSVSMPYYVPELSFPEAYGDANMRVVEHWSTLDANHFFQYICDYRYVYDERPSGVENHATTSPVQIYPNPASDFVRVDLTVDMTSAILYDLQGRVCEVLNLQRGNNIVNIADLGNGVYFLKMSMADGTTGCRKIVKR